ncbi:MAG: DedA family protein [Bdellovibrionaceae bacterium]|nr:DedA family protein [Pseudobdellovibrionaceae bacterium]MDW8190831.1 DedA family protein [Pseudobdellovibrionaceae bacterium]
MSLAEEPIFIWLSQFAYEPEMVYGSLIVMMFLSSFGLPIPEEVTLLSVGLLTYLGAHPEIFPPPFEGAKSINLTWAMVIATLAVWVSDFVVFLIGRHFGTVLLRQPWLRRVFPQSAQEKIEHWTQKYGAYTCAIFRFTPGLRFPGHLAYGMMKFPAWKFLLIDGAAVLISVPTQIYLMATYGEAILGTLKEFKVIMFSLLGILLLILLIRKIVTWKKRGIPDS